jgi:hypothetical protein
MNNMLINKLTSLFLYMCSHPFWRAMPQRRDGHGLVPLLKLVGAVFCWHFDLETAHLFKFKLLFEYSNL